MLLRLCRINHLLCRCGGGMNIQKINLSNFAKQRLSKNSAKTLRMTTFFPNCCMPKKLSSNNFGGFLSQRGIMFASTRFASHGRNIPKPNKNTDIVLYTISGVIFMIGVSYVSVPLYRMFCQATGIGGDPTIGHKTDNVSTMKPVRERPITVIFNADRHAAMQWNFKPSQSRVTVVPGETALAFYTAKNPTDTPIVGVATYNVVPFQAGPYFNKIQCFCFEEQWLNPHEEVDMPVFFYIDPEFDDDPQLAVVDEIVLSYTFFKAEQGQVLPLPGFMRENFTEAANLNVS